MAEKREKLGSRLGFILLSAGCAIGCGNVWKFPWMVGQNGGGAFVFVYLICLVLLGLPVLTMEFALGRASQRSPIGMFRVLEREGQKFHLYGYLALLGNVALMAFYMVVTGWIFNYFVKFLTGNTENIGFGPMISNAGLNVAWLAVVAILAGIVLCLNIQGGLEKVTKIMMLALFILIVALAIYSATLKGAGAGIKFYLFPDFKKINFRVIVAAMNQAFFTLGLGIGSMAIFGSYIGKEKTLLGESVNIVVLDTVAALLSGFIMFPACTTYGIEVGSGPALLFNTMATVFNMMKGGRIIGTLFFMFMVFAAMSTVFAVCENIVACVRELTGWSRKKGSIICCSGLFVVGLTTALGYSKFHFQPFAEGSAWLDFWDFIVSTNLLPWGALCFAFFCSWKFGWGWDNFVNEANTGKGLKIKSWMKYWFQYGVPAIVIALYIIGLKDFNWK